LVFTAFFLHFAGNALSISFSEGRYFMNNSTFLPFLLKTLVLLFLCSLPIRTQEKHPIDSLSKQVDNKFEALNYRLDQLEKLWTMCNGTIKSVMLPV
jgi:hypothetical protein